MPGKVTAVLVKVGDIVERGQTLMVLEAMKMELHISAPFDGTVRKIHGASGETVSRDDVLVEIDSDISAAT
jgi:biotin carboxyl carrier protein